MGLVATNKGGGGTGGRTPFEVCPAGVQQLVACDVIDHGMVTTTFAGQPPKTQHKASIRFQSEKLMRDGRPYIVQKRYTLSLHPKATLRHDLESWRGRKFTDEEAEAFDLERLIGINAYGNVIHEKRLKGLFAEIVALMPVPRALPQLTVHHYRRVQDRTPDDPRPGEDEPTFDHVPAPEPDDTPQF